MKNAYFYACDLSAFSCPSSSSPDAVDAPSPSFPLRPPPLRVPALPWPRSSYQKEGKEEVVRVSYILNKRVAGRQLPPSSSSNAVGTPSPSSPAVLLPRVFPLCRGRALYTEKEVVSVGFILHKRVAVAGRRRPPARPTQWATRPHLPRRPPTTARVPALPWPRSLY